MTGEFSFCALRDVLELLEGRSSSNSGDFKSSSILYNSTDDTSSRKAKTVIGNRDE